MADVSGYTRVSHGRTITVRGYANSAEAHRAAGNTERPPIAGVPGTFAQGATPEGQYPGGRSVPGLFPEPKPPVAVPVLPPEPLLELTGIHEHIIALSAATGRTAWLDAAKPGIDHVMLVLSNNPQTAVLQILARPDVRDALEDAGKQGAIATRDAIQKAWTINGGPANSPYLKQLLADADRNGRQYAIRTLQQLVLADRPQWRQVMEGYSLRAAAAVSVAETRAKNERLMAKLALDGIATKKWNVTRDGHQVCRFCELLDGQEIPVGAAFEAPDGLKLYGPLTCPPAHPQCQCYLSAGTPITEP